MYNSETPEVSTTTEIYSEDQNVQCLYDHYPNTHVSISNNDWKKWRQYAYCLHPNCGNCTRSRVTLPTHPLWCFQSTVQLQQPKVYSLQPVLYQTTSVSQSASIISTSTSLNLQPDTQYPATTPNNLSSNSHTNPPTTPNNLSSNSHTTPPTTPNNLSSNSHMTTPTGPTPGTISTGKPQDGTPMSRHPYPTVDSGATGHYITEQELLINFFWIKLHAKQPLQLSHNTPHMISVPPTFNNPFKTFNNLPPNPLYQPNPLQRQPLPLHPHHPINKHTNPFSSSNPFQKHVSRVDEGAANLTGHQEEVKNNKSNDGEQLMEHNQNPSTEIHDKPQGAENV